MPAETGALVLCLELGLYGGVVLLAMYGAYRLFKKWKYEKPHKSTAPEATMHLTVDDLIPNNKRNSSNASNKINAGIEQTEADQNNLDRIKALEKRIRELEEKSASKGLTNENPKVTEWLNNASNAGSVNNVSVDSAQTDYSFGSNDSKSAVRRNVSLKWSSMSDEQKKKQSCLACDNKVQTATQECNHPLFCLECLKELIPYYPNQPISLPCPTCEGIYNAVLDLTLEISLLG